jgi:hypothetical protein
MLNYEIVPIPSIEEGHIDRDRIFDGDRVPKEYFCPICEYLLWNPRSCSSCQHLFCQKCIQMWIEYENNGRKCPFRCEPFEDRRCSSSIECLLSRLNIHCRNCEFGCSEIVCYDQLEYHENVECKYLSQRCSQCDKLILVSKLSEHRQIVGLCIPSLIKCTICQNYIQKYYFREHFNECCRERINEFIQRTSKDKNLLRITNDKTEISNNQLGFFQPKTNSNLKGVDELRLSREHNFGHLYNILMTLKFILLNWRKLPFFLFVFGTIGFFEFVMLIFAVYIYFSHWIITHDYCGPIFVILLSSISSYVSSIIFQFISDKILILFFGTFIFVNGCSNKVSIEILEIDFLFNRQLISIIFCFIGILIIKIILLLIRLYYWSLPIYFTATFLTFIHFYIVFKIHRVYGYTIAITGNQRITIV